MEGDRPGFCRAHSSQTGAPCRRRVKPGAKVCAMHGAKGGRPVETGAHSQHLGRLSQSYEAMRGDRALFDLREPVAILYSVFHRLAQRVGELDTPTYRAELLRLLSASRGRNEEKAAEARDMLESLIERGAEEDRTLLALMETVSEIGKRIEGAEKVKTDKRNALGVAEQRVLFARWLDIVATVAGASVAQECGKRLHAELGASRN